MRFYYIHGTGLCISGIVLLLACNLYLLFWAWFNSNASSKSKTFVGGFTAASFCTAIGFWVVPDETPYDLTPLLLVFTTTLVNFACCAVLKSMDPYHST